MNGIVGGLDGLEEQEFWSPQRCLIAFAVVGLNPTNYWARLIHSLRPVILRSLRLNCFSVSVPACADRLREWACL